MSHLKYFVTLSLSFVLAACGQTSTPGTPSVPSGPGDVGGVEPYVMKGYVTNGQGAPLEGIEVFADNTLLYDSNILGVTDANGYYRLELPAVATTWNAGAYVRPSFEGQTYEFDLVPDNENVFAGVDGAIRNFTWKVSGTRPDGTSYYGSFVYVYGDYTTANFNVDDVELTLTPEGPLIDGSTGEAVVRQPEGGQIVDVPIGRYTISGRYVDASGAEREVLLADRDGDGSFQSSLSASFVNDPIYGPNIELFVQLQ